MFQTQVECVEIMRVRPWLAESRVVFLWVSTKAGCGFRWVTTEAGSCFRSLEKQLALWPGEELAKLLQILCKCCGVGLKLCHFGGCVNLLSLLKRQMTLSDFEILDALGPKGVLINMEEALMLMNPSVCTAGWPVRCGWPRYL